MNRTVRRAAATLTAITAGFAVLTGCSGESAPSSSKAQAEQNQLAGTEAQKFSQAVPYPYANSMPTDPLELENLAKRLTQYNSSGDTNYVYIETFGGQVVGYYVIRG